MARPQVARTSCRAPTPDRGQHQRPGKAGSAVFLARPQTPDRGQHQRRGEAGSAVFHERGSLRLPRGFMRLGAGEARRGI